MAELLVPSGPALADELRALVRVRSYRHGDFVLASGARSTRYFNLKPTMMSPRGAFLAATAFLDVIHGERAQAVGGLEMGAVPLIGALAALGEATGRPVDTFFVRKSVKAYGARQQIEGLAPGETLEGRRVLLLDDVATTGGSILQAIELVRAAGGVVDAALVLVDREEGARERLAAEGVRLLSILRAAEFDGF